jgi:hypothetical protein
MSVERIEIIVFFSTVFKIDFDVDLIHGTAGMDASDFSAQLLQFLHKIYITKYYSICSGISIITSFASK